MKKGDIITAVKLKKGMTFEIEEPYFSQEYARCGLGKYKTIKKPHVEMLLLQNNTIRVFKNKFCEFIFRFVKLQCLYDDEIHSRLVEYMG
jgi:hypothetical protein